MLLRWCFRRVAAIGMGRAVVSETVSSKCETLLLRFFVAFGMFEHSTPSGQGRFAVVNMGDDGKIADEIH